MTLRANTEDTMNSEPDEDDDGTLLGGCFTLVVIAVAVLIVRWLVVGAIQLLGWALPF